MGTDARAGPVAEFCAGLRPLQQSSGLERAALARQLRYSRSQLYEILDGRISRPPEWDRLVEPLVRACTGNDQRAVEAWRRRHGVLMEVHAALKRQAQQTNRPARTTTASRVEPAICPYRGLSMFREPDATVFFGRAGLTDLVAAQLAEKPVVALVGPSGIGKSSLVYAGLVPRLRTAGWVIASVRPERNLTVFYGDDAGERTFDWRIRWVYAQPPLAAPERS